MAKQKDTPNLPASSRMQMPSGSGGNITGITGGINKSGKGVAKRVLAAANGTGLKTKNPYC
jgi:hypothetical protein